MSMKQALLSNVCFTTARKFLFSYSSSSTKSFTAFNSVLQQPSLAALTRSRLSFYSSNSNDHNNDYVSKEELRRRIQKFYEGDEEAIPSIFEGILSRKLSGKHEESDDELMNEIRGSPSHSSDSDQSESDDD